MHEKECNVSEGITSEYTKEIYVRKENWRYKSEADWTIGENEEEWAIRENDEDKNWSYLSSHNFFNKTVDKTVLVLIDVNVVD